MSLLDRFNVFGEIIQNGLPTLALLVLRMRGLRVERHPHRDSLDALYELDDAYAIAKGIFDQFIGDYSGIGSGEVKPEATVLGLHARRERSTYA